MAGAYLAATLDQYVQAVYFLNMEFFYDDPGSVF